MMYLSILLEIMHPGTKKIYEQSKADITHPTPTLRLPKNRRGGPGPEQVVLWWRTVARPNPLCWFKLNTDGSATSPDKVIRMGPPDQTGIG
ncbi:hypothetical protein FRX31_029519 [Thalictrum thalictroides]|uniref:Uncharacterized protein n=1 Tax=Thalictrum thalictroides TaxID=46969 RepID=A0A7J6V6Z0_THATH|nr:hypothetical protein FRX31_029519 [Thalictrum thalictroides]